jgi:hypothetical protein
MEGESLPTYRLSYYRSCLLVRLLSWSLRFALLFFVLLCFALFSLLCFACFTCLLHPSQLNDVLKTVFVFYFSRCDSKHLLLRLCERSYRTSHLPFLKFCCIVRAIPRLVDARTNFILHIYATRTFIAFLRHAAQSLFHVPQFAVYVIILHFSVQIVSHTAHAKI